jgi:hypothetical protein
MLLNIDLKNAFIIPISQIRFFQIAAGNGLFLLLIVAGTAVYNAPCVNDNPVWETFRPGVLVSRVLT